MNTSTSVITGSASTAGTYNAIVTATNGNGTGSRALTITITPVTAEGPYGGTAWAVPGTVQAENFDVGGEGVDHDTDSTNQAGAYRTDLGVNISSSSDTGGGYKVDFVANGEYLKYTVNCTTAGSYTISLRCENGNFSSQTLHMEVDGTNVTGAMAIPNTGYGH